jgi:hypothetical protein
MISVVIPRVRLSDTNKSASSIVETPRSSAIISGISRPEGDIQTQWLPSGVLHYERLNDDIIEPESGDSEFIVAGWGDSGIIDIFSMDDNVESVQEVTKIEVKTYGYFVGTSRPQVSIYWNGGWQPWKVVNLPGSLYPYPPPVIGWATTTWTLEGDQDDVDDLEVKYKANIQNVPYASNLINAFYCEISYEPIPPNVIRPIWDVQTQWLPAGVTHWNKLDDYIVDPEAGDNNFIVAASYDDGAIDEFLMDNNLQFIKKVTEIKVKTYGNFVGTKRPRVSIFWNDAWQSYKTVNLPGSPVPVPPIPIGWATNTWTLEGNQQDVDDLRVRYKANVQNVIYASNLIDAFYCEISYEPGISICSPREGYDYSEYVAIDIPANLIDVYYDLDYAGYQTISGDRAMYIPYDVDGHTIRIKGKLQAGGVEYESELVSFNTYPASNDRQVIDWGVDLMDADRLWGSADGTGIPVLVIDSGIDYTHLDLDGNYQGGYDFKDDDEIPQDVGGHGTMCSGFIGAEFNDDGIIGAAPNANLFSARVGGGSYSLRRDLIEDALEWAYSSNSPDFEVISMSFGFEDYDLGEEFILGELFKSGTVLVASAGNWDDNPEPATYSSSTSVRFPAAYYQYVIPVGALDLDLTIAENWPAGEHEGQYYYAGSCFGYPENEGIMAPGTQVTTTDLTNTYYTGNGTSFAAPLVAGICALLLQIKPTLNASEVKDILYTTAIDLGPSGWDSVYGWGLINAVAAVEYAIF